jgi:hypothetical protein
MGSQAVGGDVLCPDEIIEGARRARQKACRLCLTHVCAEVFFGHDLVSNSPGFVWQPGVGEVCPKKMQTNKRPGSTAASTSNILSAVSRVYTPLSVYTELDVAE